MWKPNREDDRPIYRQIADELERRIACGEFPPGSRLPSERKLAEQLDVNRSTVVLAYAELRSLGITDSVAGSGTKVALHKWGIAPRRTPNWHRYAEGGSFQPNLPIMRRIREAIGTRESLIDMASGELAEELSPSADIAALLREGALPAHLGYDHPQGYAPLREALVGHLKRYRGIHATESSILVTSGSQQSLFLITQCLLSPGDAVAVEDPSYAYSLPMFQSAGLRLFGLPVDREGLRPDDVRELYRKHRIRMLFLNPNYHNPTGGVLRDRRREQLLDVASELGLPIVEDDPFGLTAFDGSPPPTIKAIDRAGTTLYVGSLSKIAAAGLRVGWLVAPSAVVERLADARRQIDFGLSVIPQQLAVSLLEPSVLDPHLERLRERLLFRRDALAEALRAELGGALSFELPQGGLHLWCKLAADLPEGRLLEEAIKLGVAYVPGTIYGSRPGFARFAFARPSSAGDLAEGAARFAEAVRRLLR
ncbi:PLP-dependent aminotransferase family protein [Cohnella sp. GCM10027633]|uniref:aminotransferase-like domain-containing protein n=1 Tax=unclassified Cohnella TaxID=2636738 RepID=UPI00363E296F